MHSCNDLYEDRYLQVDHRIPYEVAGEGSGSERDPKQFMPLCGTCNRKKSWSCEHCANWVAGPEHAKICKRCYWASPDRYVHIALQQVRRVEIVWSGEEFSRHDAIAKEAKRLRLPVQSFIKATLAAMK